MRGRQYDRRDRSDRRECRVAQRQRVDQDQVQLVIIDRLGEIVECAIAHGIHGAFDGAIGGDDDHDGLRTFLDWVFIFGILAAAVWLVWALFQNSEAVMEAIGKSGKTKAG